MSEPVNTPARVTPIVVARLRRALRGKPVPACYRGYEVLPIAATAVLKTVPDEEPPGRARYTP